MQMIKRELLLCLKISIIVFTGALAWGSPFTTFADGGQAATPHSNTHTQRSYDSQGRGHLQQ